jgi:hypothetical protein
MFHRFSAQKMNWHQLIRTVIIHAVPFSFLGGLLNLFGGNQVAAFEAVQNAAQAVVQQQGITGVFETVVNVGGVNVTVRGTVINGIVQIGTFF